jgi:hypothetical protein
MIQVYIKWCGDDESHLNDVIIGYRLYLYVFL